MRYCVCGWPAAADLDTCGHWACEAFQRGWGELVLKRDDGDGWRHFLNGDPVHCGSGLLLLHARGMGGEHNVVRVDKGGREDIRPDNVLRVRYESPLATSGLNEPPAFLYFDAHGHEAMARAHSGMRLRWPFRDQR